MTKPSYEELRITKHSGSPQIADSASGRESTQSATETRRSLMRITLEQVEDADSRAAELADKWLRQRGWNYTCATPGSVWMWSLEWDGKTFLVDTETAIRIQSFWDNV